MTAAKRKRGTRGPRTGHRRPPAVPPEDPDPSKYVTMARYRDLQRSRRRWIEAATFCLPKEWNGTPDDLRAHLGSELHDLENYRRERLRTHIREAAIILRRIAATPMPSFAYASARLWGNVQRYSDTPRYAEILALHEKVGGWFAWRSSDGADDSFFVPTEEWLKIVRWTDATG